MEQEETLGGHPVARGAEPGPPGVAERATGGAPPHARAGRRYSEDERRAMLREFESTEETVREYCSRRGVSTKTFCRWRQEAGAGGAGKKRRGRRKRRGHFTPEQRRETVEAFLRAGVTRKDFSVRWGVNPNTLSKWLARYQEGGPKALGPKPVGPDDGRRRRRVKEVVQREIVRTKRRYPYFGLRRIRDFLARFHGMRVSTGSVKRTLDDEGLASAPPKRRRRRRRSEEPRRFERARPGLLWQSDISYYMLRG